MLAEDVYAVTTDRYREGITSMAEVLQDEMRMSEAQNNYISAHYNYRVVNLLMLKLTGQTITYILPDTQKWIIANYKETQILLLALTYRICSIHNRKLISTGQEAVGRKNEIFIRLIQLIEQYYMKERGVEFYADRLCLSLKYLSAISKNICGYTVQELVFKAIIRKCISLLKNTQKNIQEISDEFGFPNASYFGTFFKKQMGMSPQQYRRSL